MNFHRKLLERKAAGMPLRIAVIGAGKFGTMYLAQARRTPGVHLVGVADFSVPRAREAAPIGSTAGSDMTCPGL